MGNSSSEGPDRAVVQFLRERSGTVVAVLASGIVLTGAALMVYAAGAHNSHMMSNGGSAILLPVYTYLAGAAGYGMKHLKRRSRSEKKLDDARESLDEAVERVEQLVNGPVVTQLRRR
jgi:hypothetical protein